MPTRLNSPDWRITRAGVSRARTRAGAAELPGLPPEFLTPVSKVEDEVTVEPKPTTRGGEADPGALDLSCDLAPGEAALLAVRHPSGALTFHRPTESARLTRDGRGQARFIVQVPAAGSQATTRGFVSQAVKAIVVKVAKVAADKAVSLVLPKLARTFETVTWNKKGLTEGWHKVTRNGLEAKKLEAGRPTSTDRSLLFIHGTFSNAASAYGSLAASDFFDRVKPWYGDRIFAFDHFTVSRTPQENASMLLSGLPEKAFKFDVVTHSRGGLVLRNLVERASVFGALARRFQLGRAVLVASPNEGTPLATPQRWEDTVGWIANLLEMFPENPFTTGAEFVANGLVWLASHASGDLPGIRSMDGDGAMITELQGPPGPPPGTYSALVANYSPKDKLQRLLDAGIDQFFGSANDLVVPSEGGWRVDRSGTSFIPASHIGCFGPGGNLKDESVTHVNFFSRAQTVSFLTTALSGQRQPLAPVDPAKSLPDRRLLRSGAPGISAPIISTGNRQPAGPRRRWEESADARDLAPDSPSASLDALGLTVVNGDLTFERLPLLLGHYRATLLTGTEKVINVLIGGAMKHSLDLGVYPVAPGTHQMFLNNRVVEKKPWLIPRPEAVIVVGLGEEGKLQASALAFTVRQAVIAWAQRIAERSSGKEAFFELATTLMGSGGSGVTAGQAAQLIAQGVHEANELLSGGRAGDHAWPRVRHLRMIELYLDRASEAWHALKMQAEAAPERYKLTDAVQTGTGPLQRPLDSGYRGANYDFITAETRRELNGEVSIAYALDTKRARTEVRAQTTQSRLVRDLVATGSSHQNLDAQIGRTLFKLLVPIDLEPFLAGTNDMQIELDEGTAGIPWELLDDSDNNSDKKPWAIRAKLLRKLRTETFRHNVTDADAQAHVLVIGEPECPAGYQRLYGAREEAEKVFECLSLFPALEQRVQKLFSDEATRVGSDARTVINTLFARDWRIVHIAGHGAPASADGKPGGVVLSNGTFLGPNEIKAMRVVPELVFVNCCHLGAWRNETVLGENRPPDPSVYDRARFASGVAEQLINIGVRCVIAAGWAVDDGAAMIFATTFYGSLLKGKRFIDAVADARTKVYETEGNTWAAYQCYGDPDWKFVRDTDDAKRPEHALPHEFDGIASVTALKLALETLRVQTQFQHYTPSYQLERVELVKKRWTEMKWSASGGVAELFAQAYAAAGDASSAIEWYGKAIEVNDGNVSLKALEQRGNLRVRQAWRAVEKARDRRERLTQERAKSRRKKQVRGKKAGGAAARELQEASVALATALDSARTVIHDVKRLFDELSAFHATAERENLSGSAMKRLAQVEAAAKRTKEELGAIKEMKRHYERAQALAVKDKLTDLFYPATNRIAAELALHAGERGWKGLDRGLFETTRKSLQVRNESDPDFWSVVGNTDLDLYEAVAAGRLATKAESLEQRYEDLYTRMRGGSEWGSVYDTADFVLSRYKMRASQAERKAAETLLARLKTFAAAG